MLRKCDHYLDNVKETKGSTIAFASTKNEINLFQIQLLPSLALYSAACLSIRNVTLPLDP
jgi:hypothetical protein